MKLKGQTINPGCVEGEAVVLPVLFSFVGDIDPLTGFYTGEINKGELLAGKIFVFQGGRGSSYSSGVAYSMKQAGTIPKAMLCVEADPVTAACVITADIPAIHRFDKNPLEVIKTGDYVKVDATKGIVEVVRKN